jgi:hypothetical protein
MAICRSKTLREQDKIGGLSNIDSKLKSTKTYESNKIMKNLMEMRHLSAHEINIRKFLNIRTASNGEIKSINILPQPKLLKDQERSTFFIEANENKEIIKESDIVFELVYNKNDRKLSDQTQHDKITKTKSNAQKKWGVILNVFKAINNMRNINTKNVKSLTEIDRELLFWEKEFKPLKKNRTGNKENDYDEVTKQILLFDYISLGLDENIPAITNILRSDPKRNLYDESEKQHFFINKKNFKGLTALYVACLNGHTKIVELLIKYGADHLQKCGV